MPAKKTRQREECDGCKLYEERIRILERLVGLHQFEQKRRATFEVECDALATRANALEVQQRGEVEADAD